MFPHPSPLLGAGGFVGYSTVYTSTGAQSLPVPAGASNLAIESIAGGSTAPNKSGGAGGAYARTNATSIVGHTSVYVTVGAADQNSSVMLDNASGTVINLAAAGSGATPAAASASVGTIVNVGGSGMSSVGGGGGAGGPIAAGSSGTASTGGAGGGGVAGAGGSPGVVGNIYGGGGGGTSGSGTAGAQGWVKLTWS